MNTRALLFYALFTLFSCKSHDYYTKEQNETGAPETIAWEDAGLRSILDSVAAPKLRTDTIQFRHDLINLLSFINNEPKSDAISFGYATLETDTKGALSVREITGTPTIKSQLEKHMRAIMQSLNFEPAYMLKEPEQKTSFNVDIDMYVEKNVVRFSLTGHGGVKYVNTRLQRPLQ